MLLLGGFIAVPDIQNGVSERAGISIISIQMLELSRHHAIYW